MGTDPKTQPGRPEDRSSDCAVIPLRKPALAERTDDELMQLASAGVDDAFAVLVRRYAGQVRNYCAQPTRARRARATTAAMGVKLALCLACPTCVRDWTDECGGAGVRGFAVALV